MIFSCQKLVISRSNSPFAVTQKREIDTFIVVRHIIIQIRWQYVSRLSKKLMVQDNITFIELDHFFLIPWAVRYEFAWVSPQATPQSAGVYKNHQKKQHFFMYKFLFFN